MLIIPYLRLISPQVSEQPENIDAWFNVMVDKYTESKDVGRENPTAGGLSCQTYTTLEEITSFRDDLVPVKLNDTKTGRKRNNCTIRGMQVKTWKQTEHCPTFYFLQNQ